MTRADEVNDQQTARCDNVSLSELCKNNTEQPWQLFINIFKCTDMGAIAERSGIVIMFRHRRRPVIDSSAISSSTQVPGMFV